MTAVSAKVKKKIVAVKSRRWSLQRKLKGARAVGMYFHLAPQNSVNSLHLHIVNEGRKSAGLDYQKQVIDPYTGNRSLDICIEYIQHIKPLISGGKKAKKRQRMDVDTSCGGAENKKRKN